MTIDPRTSLFAVQRGGKLYSCLGDDLADNLQDDDLLTVGRDGTTYGWIVEDTSRPWDEYDGGVWHVKNVIGDIIDLFPGSFIAYNTDGTERGEIDTIQEGEEVVFLTSKYVGNLFAANKYSTWDFGEYTDTSKVVDMGGMFYGCYEFNGELGGNWDTSNVGNYSGTRASASDMAQMFFDAQSFNQDISSWDTSNVTTMDNMFSGARDFDQDISTKEITINGNTYTAWDVSNVTDISSMFDDASAFNQDINNWNVSNVTEMFYMFKNASSFNQDLSGWCVTNITSEPGNFATGATSWTERRPCWGHCPRGESGTEDPCPPPPWEGASGIYHVIVADPNDINVSNQSKIYNLNTEQEVSSITGAGEWVVTGINTKFLHSTGNWEFGDLTDTKDVENMSSMFYNATAFDSDISNWDVGNVTNMSKLFGRCFKFDSDISGWDVGNVTSMTSMFEMASVFNSDISNWNVGKVTDMAYMLCCTFQFKSDLSGWTVDNVTNMSTMFNDSRKFNSDIGGWNVSNVTNMFQMFKNAGVFNQDLSGWCVDELDEQYRFSFKTAMPDDHSYDPVWGTCPP